MADKLKNSNRAKSKLWKRLMRAQNAALPACHVELAIEFTQKYPGDFLGWIVLADVFACFARYKDAREVLRKAQKLAPVKYQHIVWSQWGRLENKRNDLKSAERWFRRAAKYKPTTFALVFLGAVLAKQGRLAEAKKIYRQAVVLATNPVDEAYYNLGLIFRAERKYETALECFERAIRVNRNYAYAKTARKDIKEALKLKEAACPINAA